MSAKYIVNNLMNNLFGGWNIDNPETLHLKSAQGLDAQLTIAGNNVISALNDMAFGIRNSGLGQAVGIKTNISTTATTQTYPGTQGNWLGQPNLGAFNNPWSTSQLNTNRQYQFNANDYGLNSITQASQQASANISLLGSNSMDAGNSITSAFVDSNVQSEEVQRAMATSQVTTQEGTLANMITTQLIPALSNFATQLNNYATQLSTAGAGTTGFATGGLIKGPGTSKSDSIPTMLSNGEFVISADSVKKYGTNFLEALNEGKLSKIKSKLPHFADGGLINIAQDQTARGVSSFGKNMASNINNTANISVALVRDEQEGMKELLKSAEGQKIMMDFSRRYAKFTSRL